MTFLPMKSPSKLRRASNRAAEKLRRRRESVARLRPLAERDPAMWAELLTDAERRLRDALAAYPVQVGDHDPEPRCE